MLVVMATIEIDPGALEKYTSGVFDERVMNLFITRPPSDPVFVFPQGVLDFPESDKQVWQPSAFQPRRSTGLVNGLTELMYRGADGEVNSGFIRATAIETPTGQTCGAVRSMSHDNWNRMPIPEYTWACEFTNVDDMHTFLQRWDPTFESIDAEHMLTVLWGGDERYDFRKPGAFVQLYQTGLLKPWFEQEPGDRLFSNGRFATDGQQISAAFARHEQVPGFEMGRVMHYVHKNDRQKAVRSHIAQTCLGGFRNVREPHNMLDRRDTTRDVVVQWLSGELELFRGDDPDVMPVGLRPDELSVEKRLEASKHRSRVSITD